MESRMWKCPMGGDCTSPGVECAECKWGQIEGRARHKADERDRSTLQPFKADKELAERWGTLRERVQAGLVNEETSESKRLMFGRYLVMTGRCNEGKDGELLGREVKE